MKKRTRENVDYAQAWQTLREAVQRQKRSYAGAGRNKPDRDIAAGISAAYGGVVRMMDEIETSAATREP